MKLTANITLDELTKSQIAERKGINNNPNPQQIENLKALAVNVLQPIRSHFDKPLIISSGFRCAELCLEIGSSINSQHVADDEAAAADFEIPGVDNRELARWIRNNLEVDQGILEFYRDGEPTSGWIHCSYSVNTNRQQWLRAFREESKVQYKPWLE
nr:peptidase M15 [uncultured Mediterranean phage uvMED]